LTSVRVPDPTGSQPEESPMSRRPAVLRTTPLAAAALLTLTACSTGPTSDATGVDAAGDPDDAGQSAATDDGGAPAGGEDTATFPITVDHAFGSTEITEDPQRVVTVGWTDHEVMAALGEVPVGAVTINWGGNEDGSTDWFDE